MAEENDELNNEQNVEQTQGTEQTVEVGTGNIPEGVDSILDSFIEKADGSKPATKTTEDKGQQTEKLGADGKPIKQEQKVEQPKPTEQGTRENPQSQQIPTPARKFGNLFYSDQKGNVYDAQGNRLAPPGAGHQLFRRLYPYIERAETEAAGYKSKVENYERATQAAKDAGLTLDEQSASLSLMVAYKKDPKAAINFLLQQAQGRGIDTSDIVQGGGGLSEAAVRSAVQDIVQKALEPFAPIVQQTQAQQEHERVRQEAVQQYNEFMESKPDASVHAGAIASVMDSMGCDMQTAYYELKTDALSRGLDWTKPLAPQYQALRDKAGNQNSQPNGGGRNQILPDMNVRSNSGVHVEHGSRSAANADDSWDSIISSAVDSVRGSVRQ